MVGPAGVMSSKDRFYHGHNRHAGQDRATLHKLPSTSGIAPAPVPAPSHLPPAPQPRPPTFHSHPPWRCFQKSDNHLRNCSACERAGWKVHCGQGHSPCFHRIEQHFEPTSSYCPNRVPLMNTPLLVIYDLS